MGKIEPIKKWDLEENEWRRLRTFEERKKALSSHRLTIHYLTHYMQKEF